MISISSFTFRINSISPSDCLRSLLPTHYKEYIFRIPAKFTSQWNLSKVEQCHLSISQLARAVELQCRIMFLRCLEVQPFTSTERTYILIYFEKCVLLKMCSFFLPTVQLSLPGWHETSNHFFLFFYSKCQSATALPQISSLY